MAFLLIVPSIVQAADLGSGTFDGPTYANNVDGASSGIQWKSDDLFYGKPAVAPDGTIYVLISKQDESGVKLPVGLRSMTSGGDQNWQVPISGLCTDPVVDRSGSVYVSTRSTDTYDSELIKFEANGEIGWRFNMSQEFPGHWERVLGQPLIHPNGKVLVPIYNRVNPYGENSDICCIDKKGEMQWADGVVGTISDVYVGSRSDSLIYVTSYRGIVQAIDANGSMPWVLNLEDENVSIGSPSLVSDEGDLFMPVAGFDDKVNDRNWSTPQEIWRVAENGSVVMKTSLFSEHSVLYNCNIKLSGISEDGTIYCQNTIGYGADDEGNIDHDSILMPSRALALSAQGEEVWSYDLPTNFTLYSNALLNDSIMFLFPLDPDQVGSIVALQLDNGSLLGTYSAPNKLWLEGLTMWYDRLLYFEGTYKGAEEGIITLVSTIGLPQKAVERPLDLMAATVAWGSIFGLMLGGGYYVTHKRRN